MSTSMGLNEFINCKKKTFKRGQKCAQKIIKMGKK